MGLINATVSHQRDIFGTFPLICSFKLADLTVLEPLRLIVRQKSFYTNNESFKTFSGQIKLKNHNP
jgi:hypothetical protein